VDNPSAAEQDDFVNAVLLSIWDVYLTFVRGTSISWPLSSVSLMVL